MRRRRPFLLIPLQATVALFALLALLAWPPMTGRMLLVPLGTGDANPVARVALAGGATLLGSGPFPGSLVVIGDRSRILRQLPSWRYLIVAAPRAGCGPGKPRDLTA